MPIDGTDAGKPGKSEVHMDSDHQKAYEKWKKEILEPALAKHPERREEFITTSSQSRFQNFLLPLLVRFLMIRIHMDLGFP
jgi:hypothetical protein